MRDGAPRSRQRAEPWREQLIAVIALLREAEQLDVDACERSHVSQEGHVSRKGRYSNRPRGGTTSLLKALLVCRDQLDDLHDLATGCARGAGLDLLQHGEIARVRDEVGRDK